MRHAFEGVKSWYMKKPLASPPDSFSVHPLLAILPRTGSLNKLESFQSALFARYERVSASRASATTSDSQRKFQNEEAMLRVVLDWIQTSEGESR